MVRQVAILMAFLAGILASSPLHATTEYELSPEATEQVEQLKDNFEALKKSFSDGQAKLTEVEEKLAKIRANPQLMASPQVQSLLKELDRAGIDRKLANSKTILAGFERGAKSIETGTGDAIEKFNEIKGYYDRWNPNSTSPVRPLELVGNSLEKLQEVIQTLDPSPDNVLTKPIGEFIGFYKDATQAFAGALERTKVAIDARRQGCIGQGCGLGSIAGTKEAEFLALGSGDGADTINMVRRIIPGYGPAGELWANQDGSRTYIYQISREAIADGSVIEQVKGQWFPLECSLGEFNELQTGMRLAYGEVAGVPTLIARCRRDYAPYTQAKARAERYWPLFNPGRAEQFCSTRIFRRAGFADEPKATLDAANFDRATFIAQYMFRPSVRQKVDRIVPAIDGKSHVQGRIAFGSGQSPPSPNVTLVLGGRSQSGTLGADNGFELDFTGVESADRQIGKLRVTAEGHGEFTTEVAIDRRCANLGTIAVDLPAREPLNDEVMLGLLSRMEKVDARARSLAGQLDAALDSANAQLGQIDNQLAEIRADAATPSRAERAGKSAAVQRILALSDEAFAIGPRIVEIRSSIENNALNVCQSYERIKTAFDFASAGAIHDEARSSNAEVNRLLAEYQSLHNRLDQLKSEAQAAHDAPAGAIPARGTASVAASLDTLADRLALIEEQQATLNGLIDELAAAVSEAQGINAQAQAIDKATLGEPGTAAQARIAALFASIRGLAEPGRAGAAGLPAAIAGRREALAAARSASKAASPATALDASERDQRFVALNTFNASYETALIYSGKIEAAAQGGKTCFTAAEAMWDHRRELERLATNDETPAPSPPEERPGADAQAASDVGNQEDWPAADPQPEPAAEVAAADPQPEPPVEVAAIPPQDPCTLPEVEAAFAQADQAIVNRNERAWNRAIGSIAQTGCNNGRLQASVASGSAIWSQPSEPPQTATRSEPRARPRRGNRQDIGKVIGGLIGVATAIQNSRRGGRSTSSSVGDLATVLGRVGQSQPSTLPPEMQGQRTTAPSTAPSRGSSSGGLGAMAGAGVVNDPRLAEAMRARRGGGSSATGSSSSQNWCNDTVWKAHDLLNKAMQAKRSDNDELALAYHGQAADLTVQACQRGCPNVSPDFCNGQAAGWPPN